MRAVARAVSDDVVGGQAEPVRAARHDRRPARLGGCARRHSKRPAGRSGGCPIGSLAGQLAEHDEGARLELADGLDRWEAAIRDGLERMAARGELRPRRRPRPARPTHARSRTRRPAAHPDPTRPQPAPRSAGRRARRNPRRANQPLNPELDAARSLRVVGSANISAVYAPRAATLLCLAGTLLLSACGGGRSPTKGDHQGQGVDTAVSMKPVPRSAWSSCVRAGCCGRRVRGRCRSQARVLHGRTSSLGAAAGLR